MKIFSARSFWDRLVLIEILGAFIFSIVIFLIALMNRDPTPLNSPAAKMEVFFPFLASIALLICISLILWVCIGHGLRSSLWEWLPPFVFFRQYPQWIRLMVIIALLVGTVAGIIAALTGSGNGSP